VAKLNDPISTEIETQEIVDLIDHLNKKIFRIYNEEISSSGITPQQHYILRYLWKKDRVSLTELASAYCTSKSTITGVVDSLEENALIRREESYQDRRVIYVKLTKKGNYFQKKDFQISTFLNKHLEKPFNPKKLKRLHQLLSELNSLLDV